MKFYIFRHGETFNTKHSINYDEKSVIEADILPEAKRTIKRLAKYLGDKNVDFCVSSPIKRCRQTVNIIEDNTNYKFSYDKRITEYHKETVKEMVERLRGFLNDIDEKKYKSVAICSHGEPVSALTNLLTKGSFTEDDLGNYPKTGVVVIVEKGKSNIKSFRE